MRSRPTFWQKLFSSAHFYMLVLVLGTVYWILIRDRTPMPRFEGMSVSTFVK